MLIGESLLLSLIAESLSRAIVTAPDDMFLYLVFASMIVSPAIIPPSSLMYADCSSLVPVIRFAPVAHSFLLELLMFLQDRLRFLF